MFGTGLISKMTSVGESQVVLKVEHGAAMTSEMIFGSMGKFLIMFQSCARSFLFQQKPACL